MTSVFHLFPCLSKSSLSASKPLLNQYSLSLSLSIPQTYFFIFRFFVTFITLINRSIPVEGLNQNLPSFFLLEDIQKPFLPSPFVGNSSHCYFLLELHFNQSKLSSRIFDRTERFERFLMGGGNRREEGSVVIKNTNVFAALETLRKKKKSEKSKSQGKEAEEPPPPPPVFWNPTPLTTKSWADVDDEDDDDYYATTAPIKPIWGAAEPESKEAPTEESESEEDFLDEGDEEVEEEHDQESDFQVPPEPEVVKVPEISLAPKEAERQLSKKEKKKKELAELEALLADFGVASQTDIPQDESQDTTEVRKYGDASRVGDEEKKEDLPLESKSAKKKKKKDKSIREVREQEDQPNSSDVTIGLGIKAGAENAEEDASAMDVKERLKKMASVKKKKSNKELDGASKAAAIEAAARSAKLAAAKKKEKNHYNQQPVR